MVITCTGNYRKKQFFDIVNQIAIFFENHSGYKILLSDKIFPLNTIKDGQSVVKLNVTSSPLYLS